MRKEEGVVMEATGDTAKIKVGKHSECKSCGACPGNDSAIITARNKIGAAQGQRVVFIMHGANAIKGAFIIFLLPLIGMFAGAMAGGYIAGVTGFPVTAGRILGGVIAFIMIAVFIKIFDRTVGNNEFSMPEIVEIL